jgi:hypothetical protein
MDFPYTIPALLLFIFIVVTSQIPMLQSCKFVHRWGEKKDVKFLHVPFLVSENGFLLAKETDASLVEKYTFEWKAFS